MKYLAIPFLIGAMFTAPFSIWDKPKKPYFLTAACAFLVLAVVIMEIS